jgi:inhibitor of KinA sporulation pathway (predicted exonuclease)
MKHFIIYDTEYTSWEGCHENGWDPAKNQYKEIIQIGAIKVDFETLEVVDAFDRFAKPKLNPELSDYIKNLTGINQEEVTDAAATEEVLKEFFDWTEGCVCYSYGHDYDVIEENLVINNMSLPFHSRRMLDIRAFFSLHGVPTWEYNSGKLHQYLDIDMENYEHNSFFDVKSVYESLKKLLKK